jgi:uncharacterized repeat protein (TIGR02543 family)
MIEEFGMRKSNLWGCVALALVLAGCPTDDAGSEGTEQGTDLPMGIMVIFHADGGRPVAQIKTVTSGGSVGSSNMPSNPTKGDYTFDGWYTSSDGEGMPFTGDTPVDSALIVYAKWTMPNQCTVTFDADGGDPVTQTKTVTSDHSVGSENMPLNPTYEDYTFSGWYTSKGGEGTKFIDSTPVTADLTVYARWTVGFTIEILW